MGRCLNEFSKASDNILVHEVSACFRTLFCGFIFDNWVSLDALVALVIGQSMYRSSVMDIGPRQIAVLEDRTRIELKTHGIWSFYI